LLLLAEVQQVRLVGVLKVPVRVRDLSHLLLLVLLLLLLGPQGGC
jgi:hypothetical protein